MHGAVPDDQAGAGPETVCVWRRYGILVLVIEMLGATTTLLYGLNILFDPVHEELPQDPENPGLTLVS